MYTAQPPARDPAPWPPCHIMLRGVEVSLTWADHRRRSRSGQVVAERPMPRAVPQPSGAEVALRRIGPHLVTTTPPTRPAHAIQDPARARSGIDPVGVDQRPRVVRMIMPPTARARTAAGPGAGARQRWDGVQAAREQGQDPGPGLILELPRASRKPHARGERNEELARVDEADDLTGCRGPAAPGSPSHNQPRRSPPVASTKPPNRPSGVKLFFFRACQQCPARPAEGEAPRTSSPSVGSTRGMGGPATEGSRCDRNIAGDEGADFPGCRSGTARSTLPNFPVRDPRGRRRPDVRRGAPGRRGHRRVRGDRDQQGGGGDAVGHAQAAVDQLGAKPYKGEEGRACASEPFQERELIRLNW